MEFEGKLKHGIHKPEQAEARFKRLRRIIGVKIRANEPCADLIEEITALNSFLSANRPGWKGERR